MAEKFQSETHENQLKHPRPPDEAREEAEGGMMSVHEPSSTLPPMRNRAYKKIETPCDPGSVSILNFEEKYPADEPKFSEKATIDSMKRLGITPKMLMKPTDAELSEYSSDADLKHRAENILLSQRKLLIDQIVEEREKVLSKPAITVRSSLPTPPSEAINTERAIQKVENLQKREIEQVILGELIKEQTIKDEEARNTRRETSQQKREEEIRKSQEEEASKRKQKQELISQKIAEHEKMLEEMKHRQEEVFEKNQRVLEQMRTEKLKSMAETESLRQEKSRGQRALLEAQRKERERILREQQLKNEQREKTINQKREEQNSLLKQRNEQNFLQQRSHLEAARKNEKANFEMKKKLLEEKETKQKMKYEVLLTERDRKVKQMSDRDETVSERHKAKSARIKVVEKERINKIVFRERKDVERRAEMERLREEKVKADADAAAEKKKKIEKFMEEKGMAIEKNNMVIEKKLQDGDLSVEKAKKNHDEKIEKSAEVQRLKERIQRENAERLRRMREARIEEECQEAEQKEKSAEERQREIEAAALRKKEEAEKLNYKKDEVIMKFREMMSKGGKFDFERLVKDYNLDIEALREKAREKVHRKSLSARSAPSERAVNAQ